MYAAEDLTDDLSCSLYDLLTSKRVEGYRNELDEIQRFLREGDKRSFLQGGEEKAYT